MFFLSFLALVQEVQNVSPVNQADVPMSYVAIINDAVTRMRRLKPKLETRCMRIAVRDESYIEVEIYPRDNVSISSDSITINSSPCPPGGTVRYAKSGAFLGLSLAK